MTTAVPTNGFVEPAAGTPAQVPNGNTINIPAPQPAPQQPQVPAQGAQPLGMDAAIAALTEALKGTQPQQAKAPETEQVSGALATYDVSKINDPIIQSMATVLQNIGKGVDLDRAIGKAIDDGRVDLIDVAYLREKGGDNAESLISIAQAMVTAIEAKSTAISNEVHALAGGRAQWDAGVAVFNQSAPPELKMIVAQMLDSGKDNIIKAGAKFVVDFGKGSALLPNVNPALQPSASAPAAAQALDKFQFQAELNKLNPQDRNFMQQREALFARRQLGRQLGK